MHTVRSNSKYGQRHGIYYFLGNIPAHLNHAILLYEQLGGTFVVLSEEFYEHCRHLGIPAIMLDNRPKAFLQFPRGQATKTINFLNQNASVVIYFEIFTISKYINVPQVFLSHGNSLKNYFIDWRKDVLPYYTVLAGLGPHWREQILQAGGSPKQVINMGGIRSDRIIKYSGRVKGRRKVAKKLGLTPRKPIVSYMPTWWGPTSVSDLGLSIVRNMSEEYSLIFRPHPQTPQDLIDKYLSVINKEKLNACYVPEENPQGISILQIYEATNLFICDMSSVVLDIILTKKPILFAFGSTGGRQSESSYEPIKEIFDMHESITAQNVRDENEIIQNALSSQMDEELMKLSISRVHYGLEGQNTKDTVELIKALCENRSLPAR